MKATALLRSFLLLGVCPALLALPATPAPSPVTLPVAATLPGDLPGELIDIMESATLHLDFSSGGTAPEFGHATVPRGQPSAAARLPEGYVFVTQNGQRLRFNKGDALDFSRPGSLALWVSPRGWQWGNERPYNPFFNASWEGGGSLTLTRQGLLHPQGAAVQRQDRILLSFRSSTGGSPLTVMLGASDPQGWADGSWHLLVLTWDGPVWGVSIDGGGRKHFTPASAINQQVSFSIGGTQEATAFKAFTIFSKALSDEAIATLYHSQRPAK